MVGLGAVSENKILRIEDRQLTDEISYIVQADENARGAVYETGG